MKSREAAKGKENHMPVFDSGWIILPLCSLCKEVFYFSKCKEAEE
jgi:hypothetical protein